MYSSAVTWDSLSPRPAMRFEMLLDEILPPMPCIMRRTTSMRAAGFLGLCFMKTPSTIAVPARPWQTCR